MGRPPGAKNIRHGNGNSSGWTNAGGRKTLITNGRRGPPTSARNGPKHSKLNGVNGEEEAFVTSDAPVDYTNQVAFPYDVRLNGFSTLLETVKNGSESVRKAVMDECDIILECRICRNLFRSLPNYVQHKRVYCKETFRKVNPAGLTQLLQLAKDSFDVSGNSLSTTVTEPVSLEQSNAVPPLKRPGKLNGTVSGDEVLEHMESQHQATNGELRLLDNTTRSSGLGGSRRRRADFQTYVDNVQMGNSARRMIHDAVLVGPNGKVACMADPGVLEDIVVNLQKQAVENQVEEAARAESLKCSICHTWFDTEKSLRIHVRTHAKLPPLKVRKKRRKASPGKMSEKKSVSEDLAAVPSENEKDQGSMNGGSRVPSSSRSPLNSTTAKTNYAAAESVPSGASAKHAITLSDILDSVPSMPDPASSATQALRREVNSSASALTGSNDGATLPTMAHNVSKTTVPVPNSTVKKKTITTSPLTQTPRTSPDADKDPMTSPALTSIPPTIFYSAPAKAPGRRTNNSVSANLSSPGSAAPVLPLNLTPSPSEVKVGLKTPPSDRARRRTVKKLFPEPKRQPRGRPRKISLEAEPAEPKRPFTCFKCNENFRGMKSLTGHLKKCEATFSYSISPAGHGEPATPKIRILDRNSYYNGPSSPRVSPPKSDLTLVVPVESKPIVLVDLTDDLSNNNDTNSEVTVASSSGDSDVILEAVARVRTWSNGVDESESDRSSSGSCDQVEAVKELKIDNSMVTNKQAEGSDEGANTSAATLSDEATVMIKEVRQENQLETNRVQDPPKKKLPSLHITSTKNILPLNNK